jgi:hypothetical protein
MGDGLLHSPPRLARAACEGMPISSGIMCWCTRTQSYRIGERLGEGLGHRGGVLRGLIQDLASDLRRIPIPRTRVNKGKEKDRSYDDRPV